MTCARGGGRAAGAAHGGWGKRQRHWGGVTVLIGDTGGLRQKTPDQWPPGLSVALQCSRGLG